MGATALSDMLYAAFVVWSIVLLTAYAEDRRLWLLAASAACVAAAAMTRWVGFTLALSGGLWLLLEAMRSRRLREAGLAVVYGLVSVAPLAVWEIIDPISRGEGALRSSPGQAPVLTNLATYAATLGHDLGLALTVRPSRTAIVLAVLRWVLVGVALAATGTGAVQWIRTGRLDGLALALPGVIAWATYVAVVSVVRSFQFVPYLVTRYVAPFYPVGFAIAAAAIVWLAKWGGASSRLAASRRWIPVAAAVLLAAAAPPYLSMLPEARLMRQGVEVTSPLWREDPSIAFVARRHPDVVFSTVASFVYTLTELPGVRLPDGASASDAHAAFAQPPLAGRTVLVVLELPPKPGAPTAVDAAAYTASGLFAEVFRSSHTVVLEARAAR